ncbi:MAG: Protein translocase subunit SecD [Oscillospiraceae bacterium]|jgi:preprotein translocase subunit SecD
MKRVPKPVFFIVALLILLLTYTSVFGIKGKNGDNTITYIKGIEDIRWGTDINGGVEATFSPATTTKATKEQLDSAESIIKLRLVNNNITDYEVYTDYNHDRIIVRFPWKSDEEDFDPQQAIDELSATALVTFREGMEYETETTGADGQPIYKTPAGVTASNVILEGSDIQSAQAQLTQDQSTGLSTYQIALKLSDSGAEKFAEATERLKGDIISIWMDDTMISWPTVDDVITDGNCVINSPNGFTAAEASSLANKINAGALPFKLTATNFSATSPTLGKSSLNAMLYAGLIAFGLIFLLMIFVFRLPGLIATIALLGQIGLTFAAISGYFSFLPSFTMTLPGLAGIILSIGMGVDANIIFASRIKEELWNGKTLDMAIYKGSQNSFWAIFDGNITIIIVAILLMLVFGPKNILSALFGPATTGSIYSFGYTLLIGVIGNFIMGVMATRLMIKAISGFQCVRRKWLFGGAAE